MLSNINTTHSTTINNYNTINNLNVNNLNVNFLLKTKCNDAISIEEFISELELTNDDLQYTQENGYVKGVSNVFIKNLNQLEPDKRPIQCSDKRGNNIYIKDTSEWKKDEDGIILDHNISIISSKQVKVLNKWTIDNINSHNDNVSNVFMHLILNTMGGRNCEERRKNSKIIQRNIGKHCSINDIKI